MSIRRCAFLLLLATSLVACDRQTTPARQAAQTLGAAPGCPSPTFEGFFAAFADDTELQKEFVRLPLRSDSIDAGAEPEPKPVTKMLTLQELEFPLVPSKEQVADEGLKTSFSTSGTEMDVELIKPDTDYMVTYYFQRAGDCWRLYRKDDASL
jgi:hypothetical protein